MPKNLASAGRTRLGAILIVLLIGLQGAAGAASDDGSELRARTQFAAGNYREALDIYARLYAETLHPTYLRNIARCHQNLGDADRAISSFREYLRKAKNLSAEQRAEIDGYIAEMEQLKRSRAAAPVAPARAAAAAAPVPPVPIPPAVAPPAPAPAPADSSSSALLDSSTVVAKAGPDTERRAPLYARWWFWAAIGGVAVAGVAGALLLSNGRDSSHGNIGALDLTDKGP